MNSRKNAGEIILQLHLKQSFYVDFTDRNIFLASFRKPNLGHLTRHDEYHDNTMLFLTLETDDKGNSKHYLRYTHQRCPILTMQDVDEMERKNKKEIEEYEASLGRRKAFGVAQGIVTVVALGVVKMMGGNPNPIVASEGIKKRYSNIVGEEIKHFDKEEYLRTNTFDYQGNCIILDSNYRSDELLNCDWKPVYGTSPHCSIDINRQNCISLRSKGIYYEESFLCSDKYDYRSFEFYYREDAYRFYDELKRIYELKQSTVQ